MRALFVFASIALAAQQAPAPCLDRPLAERPYTRLRLIDVIRDQTPVRAEYLIKTCGVRIPFTADLEADLKEAGAEEGLIKAVKEVAPKPAAPPPKPEPVKVVEPPKPAGPQAAEIKVNPKDGLRYAYISPGTFRMGCASSGDEPCDPDEKPAHDVRITKGFWMGQTEVTVEAYKRFASNTGKTMPRLTFSESAQPMTEVSWHDAAEYCSWAGLRLPTEAEWEYAARAGTTGARYGNLDSVAWYRSNSSGKARAVAQKDANAFKLHDMLGNVWEWTADWYKDKYESSAQATDPQGPPGGEYRVLRGGSWNYNASHARASNRYWNQPSNRYYFYGFRCVGETLVP
ncbi:MAG: formylglycine-generating enzyme family protein [Bryobacteraceae bacterium]